MKPINLIFTLLVALLVIPTHVNAQVTIGSTTSTSSTERLINRSYKYGASEILYLASEINSTGNITKLEFNKLSGSNVGAIENITVYMKNTTDTALPTGAVGTTSFSGYTQVYSGNFPNTAATGWFEISLTNPFTYSGNNLSILTVKGFQDYTLTGYPYYQYTTSGTSSSTYKFRYTQSDTSAWTATTSLMGSVNRPNIRLTLAASNGCNAPTNLTASGVTDTTASTSWTAPTSAPASGYEYYMSTSATAPSAATTATGTIAAETTSKPFTALLPNTTYNMWIRSVCSDTAKSNWSSTLTFTTACGAANLPYTQNFDGVTAPALPVCFTTENVNGDSNTWKTYQYTSASSPNSAYVTSASGGNNDNLYTQGVNLTAGETYRLSLKYYIPYSYNYKTDFWIKYGTAANAAAMQQTLLSLVDVAGISGNTSFTTFTAEFVAAQTGVYYIGLQTQDQGGIYVDDISLIHIPACQTVSFPTAVAAVASKSSICTGEGVTFSLGTAMPTATGITYQWKSSANGTAYTNASSASSSPSATLTVNANARWFKCEVLCNGNVVLTSAPVEVGINVRVLSVNNTSRCGAGTVSLSAEGQTGNTIKWYDASNGGNLLGSGSPFTSPQIAHTTTFYAAATGTVSSYTAGPATPQSVSTSYGSTNNAETVYFNLATDIKLTSVNIYPVDAASDNVIYLKDASNNIIKQLTFSTVGASLSTTSVVGSPYVLNLNWDIPAGNGYRMVWGMPDYSGANRLLRNTTNAASQYNTNTNGITFTGNDGFGNSYWYYYYNWKFTTGCGESDIRVPLTATVNYEWQGAADTNWNNPANWCGGVLPQAIDDITIGASEKQPVISGMAYANNLTVPSGTSVKIATGGTLTLSNTLNVANGGSFIIEDNAALLQTSATAVNTGAIIQHKNSNALYRLDYTLWSSPVTGTQTLHDFSPNTLSNRYYEYMYGTNSNSVSLEAYWAVDATTTTWEPAKGFLIRMPNHSETPNFNEGNAAIPFDAVFNGTPNNGTITKALSTDANRFTATGNPYPSPINVASFFAANSSVLENGSGIWLWRKRNNATSSSYATLTTSAFVANPATGGGAEQAPFYAQGNEANWLIAQGQGFFVKTASGLTNPEVTFNNAMRRAMPGATQGFFKSAASSDEGVTKSRIWLNMFAAEGSASQTAIAYQADATLGLDYAKDGKTFVASNELSFYSLAQTEKLAVQARPAFEVTDVVPMGFNTPAAGEFTISIDHVDGLFENGQTVYLRDNQEGIVRNLSQYDYSFTSEAGTFENRFEVFYQNGTALGTDAPVLDANSIIVYKQDKAVNINSGNTLMNGVKVFDIRGRLLFSQSGINATTFSINSLEIQQQVIILEIATKKGTVSKRIVY